MLNSVQKTLMHWITERELIRAKKDSKAPKPWTKDPILRDYKFCNVKREDDRVTKWVFENWLYPHNDHINVAFAMCVARHFNWPDTLEVIGFPHEWDHVEIKRKLKDYRDNQKKKVYTGAYTVSTCGRAMDKVDYSIDVVLTPLFHTLRAPEQGERLETYWNEILKHEGFASFMAGQVVADLKFIRPLSDASDWNTWAPLGPGSIRGLNRFFGRPITYNVRQGQGLDELRQIQAIIKAELNLDLPVHNVQNCMCEFDKYIRLRDEGGKVRSKYNGLF